MTGYPPPKAAKGSILDLLASSPPSSPVLPSQSPYSPPIPPPSHFRHIKPAPTKKPPYTEPAHPRRSRSRSPALKAMSSSSVNNRRVQPESSAAGAARAFKWANDTDVLDLTMEDYEKPHHTTITPAIFSHKPSIALTDPHPRLTSMKRKSTEPESGLPTKRTTAARPPILSQPPQKRKWFIDKDSSSSPDRALTPTLDQDDSGDEDEWGGIHHQHGTAEPVKPVKHNAFYLDDDDDHYRPPEALKSFSLEALIDSIPLVERAPVGRRRLMRMKDLDNDGSGSDDDAEETGLTLQEQIESDRAMITEAAGRLQCKKTWVTTTRKEEVVIMGDQDGAAAAADIAEEAKDDDDNNESEVVDRKGKGKANAKPPMGQGLLHSFLHDDDDTDDEDMVLRRPGESPPKRKAPPNPNQPKAPEPDINDDTEWIQGGDLGQRDANRKFKDITEKKLMWRVPGMRTPLLEHQVLGVDWMLKHEMSDARPRGGLVADAMGLGKTIQSIATMVVNPAPPSTKPTDPTVTLIVAPVALLQQWADEIRQHAKAGNFAIHIHHGATKLHKLQALRNCDVVITSYATVMHSYPSTKKPRGNHRMTIEEEETWWDGQWRGRGILHRINFWRVILDESHILKNRSSRTSLACQSLHALHTWALSGTPIQNSLDDIYPVFRFIRHPHVGSWEQFKIVAAGNSDEAAKRVQAVLRGCMMRRNKKDQLLGTDLVVLPRMRKRMIELEFSEEERALYKSVEDRSREVLNGYIRDGTVMMNYTVVLVMLLRLRQICDHPYLILTTINDQFTVADLDRALPANAGFGAKSGLRHILDAARIVAMGDITECSICLDAPEGPVITHCKHVFCRDCISSHITSCARAGNPASCPLCKREVTIDSLTNYRAEPEEPEEPEEPAKPIPRNQQQYRKPKPKQRLKKKPIQDPVPWLTAAGPFMHSAKTLALRDQLLEWRANHPGDKIVLFSQFTRMLDIVERVLDEEGWGLVRYQGSMDVGEREEALRVFRADPECLVLVTSLRAGGVGLNLVDANLVVCLDLWWNAAVELQAFDRVHRMGQKKEVFVSRLIVAGTVEQRMLALQEKKQKISNAALGDGAGENLGRLTQGELVGLFGKVVEGPGGVRVVADGA